MTASFAVIMQQRQHFGNKANTFSQFPFGVTIDDFGAGTVASQAGSAPFVGPQKDFTFDCPGVDRSKTSVLMFQSLGVQHEGNLIAINPDTIDQPTVFGGIPVIPAISGALPTWSANVMLVRPTALIEAGNVLRITSRPLAGGVASELDDFVIDNVVLMYSTRTSSGGTHAPI